MEKLSEIIKEIKKNKGRPYIAGGYVRDITMGITPRDMDIEVFGMTPEKLMDLLKKFGNPRPAGKFYNIYILGTYEFSIPKRQKIIDNQTEYIEDETLTELEACLRRDLTINSMLMDIETGSIIDYYGGKGDIKNKVIRYTNADSFIDDPVRILRAAGFAARFDFEIDNELEMLAVRNADRLGAVPKERIFIEIEKILMRAPKPSKAFYWLDRIGVLSHIFPELTELKNVKDDNVFHGEENVFVHSMMVIDLIPMERRTLDIMFAALLHDIGKTAETMSVDGERIHYFGHAEYGAEKINTVMKAVTDNIELIYDVKKLVKYHDQPINLIKSVSSKQVRKLASKVDMEKLMILNYADVKGRGKPADYTAYIERALEIYHKIKGEIKPILGGKDLIEIGLNPSKQFSGLLKKLYEAQLDEKFYDIKSAKQYLAENIEYLLKNS